MIFFHTWMNCAWMKILFETSVDFCWKNILFELFLITISMISFLISQMFFRTNESKFLYLIFCSTNFFCAMIFFEWRFFSTRRFFFIDEYIIFPFCLRVNWDSFCCWWFCLGFSYFSFIWFDDEKSRRCFFFERYLFLEILFVESLDVTYFAFATFTEKFVLNRLNHFWKFFAVWLMNLECNGNSQRYLKVLM